MKTIRITVIQLFLLFYLSISVYAKLSCDNSYAILSKDGRRIFVMLTETPNDDEIFILPDNTKVNLRKTFHSSGVFNLTSKKPIWLFNWYSRNSELQTSGDFSSIIRLNSFALHFSKSWGLKFIHNGKTVKTYSLDSLVTTLRSKYFFPFTTAGYYHVWDNVFSLQGDSLKLIVSGRSINIFSCIIPLGYQESYVFDSNTGAILEKHIKNIPLTIAMIILPIALVLIFVLFFMKRNRECLRG